MRRIAVLLVTAVTLTGCTTYALTNGKGKGNGKPATAAVETIDTTPEDTWPPTTTIPFDPGTEIAGYLIEPDLDNVRWGDTVQFTYSYEGTLSNRGELYIQLVCLQGAVVVYQASDRGDYATGAFTLSQQDGLAAVGILIDTASPGSCVVELRYRILNDKDHTYQTLDSLTFPVGPA